MDLIQKPWTYPPVSAGDSEKSNRFRNSRPQLEHFYYEKNFDARGKWLHLFC